jgi:hypothetical protein
VNYNYATDFNGVGEFHAVLTSQWDKERSLDPSFASGVNTSTFDMDADYKIREFFREGKFNPLSQDITEVAFDDRMKYTVFVLGRYFLMRGKNEIAFCEWDQIKFHSDIVNGTAEEYVEVVQHWDKTNKCKLKNTKPRDLTEVAPRIYANPNDELCPYNFLKFLRGLCAPSQERVLCYAAKDEELKEFVAGRHPYLYHPKLPVGGNKIGPLCKKMAREMGFMDWEKCTGHGLCKMGITHAMTYSEKNIAPLILGMSRHKNYQTSLAYQKPNADMYKSYNKAICGKHVSSPPADPSAKKKKAKNKKNDHDAKIEDVDEFPVQEDMDASHTEAALNIGTEITIRKNPTVRDLNQNGTSSIVMPYIHVADDVETHKHPAMGSSAISSVMGAIREQDSIAYMKQMENTNYGGPMISGGLVTPYHGWMTNPVYNHMQSNYIQRNIIVYPTHAESHTIGSNVIESELNHHALEKKGLQDKVTKLEMQLQHQKERFDDMKYDLRDVKREKEGRGKPIIVSTCVLL